MGSILYGICQCGYETGGIFVGGGMMNFTTECIVPAYCRRCHKVVKPNYLEENPVCPKCKGEITFYSDPNLRKNPEEEVYVFTWATPKGEVQIARGKHICPKCQKMGLEFVEGGLWD